MNNVEKKKVYAFEHNRSPVTSKIVDKLKDGQLGDIVTDEELATICGRDTRPKHKGYNNLGSAIQIVLRDYKKFWERERGADCIRCLISSEIVKSCEKDIKKIWRKSKKVNQKASIVDISSLGKDEAKRFLTNIAISGTIELLSRKDTMKKLMVRETKSPIDLPKLLEAFK